MMMLSKEYVISVNFPVKYINFPADKVIANPLPDIIDIDIQSTGFNLLWYQLRHKSVTLSIDIQDATPLTSKNHYYLLSNSRLDKITSQFNSAIKILKVYPGDIFLNYNKKETKRVPVRAKVSITFQNQYQQKDSLILTPAFIDVSGASDVVDKIKQVETVPVNLKNVTGSVSLKLNIRKTPDLKYAELSQPTVQATLNVTKFTEAVIEIPLEVENLPLRFVLKTFPDKISVKYNVAFDNYEKINVSQFKAIVDYKTIETGNNKLKVQLVKYPSEIRAVKIYPEKVEYIIKK